MDYSVSDGFLAMVKRLKPDTNTTLRLLEWATDHPNEAWKVAADVNSMTYRCFFQFARMVSDNDPLKAVEMAHREDCLERSIRNLKVAVGKRMEFHGITDFTTPSGVSCHVRTIGGHDPFYGFELNPGGSVVTFYVGKHAAYDMIDSLMRESTLGHGYVTISDAEVDGNRFSWRAPGDDTWRANEATIISEAVRSNIKPKIQLLIGTQ